MVCGPTACGKSELADYAADLITERYASHSSVVVVDSMQVYKEIPQITNQARRRSAELTGIVSVVEKWTMARHREACDGIINTAEVPSVLDAGTGMYLNAILLDVPLAPQVSEDTRRRAEAMSTGASNLRRATREKELELAGAEKPGSIWEGTVRYGVEMIYLRPDKGRLDAAIRARSSEISRKGAAEAATLLQQFSEKEINISVKGSIGVRELISHAKGELTLEEAEQMIESRTRRLARRQTTWFDKLARVLKDKVHVLTKEGPQTAEEAVKRYVDKLQA